jgi:hypothetical protein
MRTLAHRPSVNARSLSAVLGLAALLAAAPAPLAVAGQVKAARLKYGGGGDWYANPTSVPRLLAEVRKRTTTDIAPQPDIVEASSPRLFDYAIVFATGHGRIVFTPAERRNLRSYLAAGGFLHVDDNYGLDEFFRPEVRALFPGRPMVELPFSHPIYRSFYDFPGGLPKIHEHHGGPPHGYAILHEGRVVLFYSYNTDLSDGWEAPDVHHDPPEVREQAFKMGVNIVVYALTH